MFCRNCGKQIADQAMVCVSCGVAAGNGTGFCQNCGSATDAVADVCIKCGVRLAPSGELKSKIVAGILGILLGGLGIHRFYLGYTRIGILQIVVTIVTCGAGSLWGFVEGILILVGNMNRDAQGRPLKD